MEDLRTYMDVRIEREKAAYQFVIQASRLGYEVKKRLSPYKYLVQDKDDWREKMLTVIVLPTSFDFYQYRLHKSKKFDMLVVQRHNAILPVEVVDMETSMKYAPGDSVERAMRENAKRRNDDEKALLLSQIICGAQAGSKAVEEMPDRMRQRYLKEARAYLRGRVGRPFAS